MAGTTIPNLANMYAKMFGVGQGSPKMLPQGIDFTAQAQDIARQQARAEELSRAADNISAGSEVSGHFVPNYGGMIAGLGKALLGGYERGQLAEQAQQIAAAQQAAHQQWLSEFPPGTGGQPAVDPQKAVLGGAGSDTGDPYNTMVTPPPTQPTAAGSDTGDPYNTQVTAGKFTQEPTTTVGGLPMIPKKPATPDEIMQWAARGTAFDPTLTRGITSKVVGNILDEPEKEAERANKREIAAEALAEKRERSIREAKIELERMRQISEDKRYSVDQREAADKRHAQLQGMIGQWMHEDRQAKLEAAKLGGKDNWVGTGSVDPLSGNEILRDKNDPTRLVVAGTGERPTAGSITRANYDKHQDAIATANATREEISTARQAVQANSKAFDSAMQKLAGYGSRVPAFGPAFLQWAQGKLSNDEQRAVGLVSGLSAEIIKQRYGTAYSGTEERQGIRYLPAPGDSSQVVINKLNNLDAHLDAMDKKFRVGKYAIPVGADPVAYTKAVGGGRKVPNLSEAELLEQYTQDPNKAGQTPN